MFGAFSLSTIALVGLYGFGFVQMFQGARKSGKGYMAAATYAATWPVTLWKVMNDLWRSEPPVE